jgi:hypothetical protein
MKPVGFQCDYWPAIWSGSIDVCIVTLNSVWWWTASVTLSLGRVWDPESELLTQVMWKSLTLLYDDQCIVSHVDICVLLLAYRINITDVMKGTRFVGIQCRSVGCRISTGLLLTTAPHTACGGTIRHSLHNGQ